MPYVTEPFQAFLSATLDYCDTHLPLSDNAHADLLKLLKEEGSYTFLSLRDDVHFETVKAYARNGCFILIDRGLVGTMPAKFSFGTCVSTLSPTAVAAMRAMLDETALCGYDPDAMGAPPGVAFTDLPIGSARTYWRGMVVFSGTLPIHVTASGVPSWLTVTQLGNMIELTGTPPVATTTTISLHARNNQENSEINQQFSIVVR